jgi:hypothetical protein
MIKRRCYMYTSQYDASCCFRGYESGVYIGDAWSFSTRVLMMEQFSDPWAMAQKSLEHSLAAVKTSNLTSYF